MHDRLVAIDDALAKIALEVVVAGQPAPLRPRRLQFARGSHRRPLVGGDDREKALDPDDATPGSCAIDDFVDRDERRAERRRTDRRAVQHARAR